MIDGYYPIENKMTVFGFGRHEMDPKLAQTDISFSIGLLPLDGLTNVAEMIQKLTE